MKKQSKDEALQNGFGVFMQRKTETAAAQVKNTPAKTDDGETFNKHNLFFSDVLFEKVKILCSKTGKPQREVLDTIIRKYVSEYENKHGELVAENIDL